MAAKKTKFFRSETERMIAGVCGGLAEYFNLDPTLIRLIFVFVTLFGGSGVIAYLVLWIIIPSQSNLKISSEETIKRNVEEIKSKAQNFTDEIKDLPHQKKSKNWFGLILIILGCLFLLSNLGLFKWRLFWPFILIILGLVYLFKA